MTLIIGSLRKMDVVITADGRSIQTRDGVVTRILDDTQKIFPVQGQSVVIAHHGQNMFDGHPVAQIIRDFSRTLCPGLSIIAIADTLREALHDEVRRTLADLPNFASGCWVVGFGCGEDEPRHVEIFWQWEADQCVIRETHWIAPDIILAGDGKNGLSANIDLITSASVATVQAQHRRLMDRALNADVKPNSVGGHVHEVLMTPHGWEWTIPPIRVEPLRS